MSIRLRTMHDEDLVFANEVRDIAGWNQTMTDWRRFMALEPKGCFIAEWNGEPAGTATTTCYGKDLAWIGMVLVHPDFRRRGLGNALLDHCITYLRDDKNIHSHENKNYAEICYKLKTQKIPGLKKTPSD